MKKKLVVLLMAGSMALAACGTKDAAATTAAVETTVAESTEAETTEAGTTDAETTEAETTEAESTEAGAAAGEINVGEALGAAMGFELEEKDGKYFMNYPAAMFAGLPEDAVKEAVAADSEGIVTINDDGSVVVEITKEEFDAMNLTFGQ